MVNPPPTRWFFCVSGGAGNQPITLSLNNLFPGQKTPAPVLGRDSDFAEAQAG